MHFINIQIAQIKLKIIGTAHIQFIANLVQYISKSKTTISSTILYLAVVNMVIITLKAHKYNMEQWQVQHSKCKVGDTSDILMILFQ